MDKIDKSKNLFEDIKVFEYVAGTQSSEEKDNFEKVLSENSELQEEVASEQDFRILLKSAQPESVISENNINGLFDMIDEQEATDQSASSNVISHINFNNRIAGSAIAACLVVAVFFSVNFNNSSNNNDLLEPNFQTLSDSRQTDTVNLKTLARESRLIKITTDASLSPSSLDVLLSDYDLSSLNKTPNSTSVIVKANEPITDQKLSILLNDKRVTTAEFVRFNESSK